MSGLSRRERFLVLTALAVALAIGLPGLLTLPGAKGATPEEARGQRRVVAAELARVRREVASLRTAVERRLASGSPDALVPQMVHAAQAAAAAARVRLSDVKPAPVEDAEGLRRLPLDVSLSAPFSPALRFLFELERRDRRFRVERLRLSAAGSGGDSLDIDVRLVSTLRAGEVRDEQTTALP